MFSLITALNNLNLLNSSVEYSNNHYQQIIERLNAKREMENMTTNILIHIRLILI